MSSICQPYPWFSSTNYTLGVISKIGFKILDWGHRSKFLKAIFQISRSKLNRFQTFLALKTSAEAEYASCTLGFPIPSVVLKSSQKLL
jgi:hypothetical protein